MSEEGPAIFRSSLHQKGQTYVEATDRSPCDGCRAWCCRTLTFKHHPPKSLMDLDYIRYMMGFSRVRLMVSRDESWDVLVEDECRHLDQATNRCTVHGTAEQPLTCSTYDEHECWYTRSFEQEREPDSVQIGSDGWETVLAHIRLDDKGILVDPLSWSFLKALLT